MANRSVQHITLALLENLSHRARKNNRERLNHNFHQPRDIVQRFLNAIEPDSYVRPHRHIAPERDEVFLVLKGEGAVIIFDKNGMVENVYSLNTGKGQWGVDIPGGIYHTIISLEKNSVFYEIKPGPYNPDIDKGFADWAPEENTPAAREFLTTLKGQVENFTPSR